MLGEPLVGVLPLEELLVEAPVVLEKPAPEEPVGPDEPGMLDGPLLDEPVLDGVVPGEPVLDELEEPIAEASFSASRRAVSVAAS